MVDRKSLLHLSKFSEMKKRRRELFMPNYKERKEGEEPDSNFGFLKE
jgi:hypothetical protein